MVSNDPHNRKQPFILGMIALVSGIILALFVISKVKAASEPQYIFYVNGNLYGTNTQRDVWVYPAGILDQSNVVYSYGPANAVQTVYSKVNGNWQESEAPVHLQSTVNFTMVKGTFSYTNYEPEYIDEHFIPLTFDTAYSPKSLIAQCTECTASDPFYNVVYFQDNNSFRWYCYAHNGEIRFCNDNVILVQPSGALWYWETQDDQGDRWVLLDTSHVGVQGTDYLVYRAMWVIYARGSNLVAVTDYSSATVPSWPPTHGGGHSFNDGYVSPISSFGYDDTCTIDYMQCVFADPVTTSSPTPTPTTDVDINKYHILLNHVNGVYNHTSYMVSFKASGILAEYNQPLNSTVESVLLESGTESTLLKYNAKIIKTGSYEGSWLSNYYGTGYVFYIKCESFSDLKLYKNSSAFASNDFSYIENNYSFSDIQEGNLQNQGNSYDVFYYVSEVDDGYILAFSFKTGQYGNVSEFDQFSDIWFQEGSINSTSNTNYFVPFKDGSDQYKMALGIMLDVENNAVPDPNVSPSPEPTATPSPPPYVIIITPDPSPTPTPPFVIPTMPPWNPPGNQIVPLDPDTQENVFGVFKNKIGDNNAFGLFGLLIGLLPGDLMWYLWFLLFILLVVGVAKLIIHFTGG